LLANGFWENCTLIDLLEHCPQADEIEPVYGDFVKGMADWHVESLHESRQMIFEENAKDGGSQVMKRYAGYFFERLFIVYRDVRDKRPTETLLAAYVRMLNPGNEELIEEAKGYRNKLLDVSNMVKIPGVTFLDEWKVGKL